MQNDLKNIYERTDSVYIFKILNNLYNVLSKPFEYHDLLCLPELC